MKTKLPGIARYVNMPVAASILSNEKVSPKIPTTQLKRYPRDYKTTVYTVYHQLGKETVRPIKDLIGLPAHGQAQVLRTCGFLCETCIAKHT